MMVASGSPRSSTRREISSYESFLIRRDVEEEFELALASPRFRSDVWILEQSEAPGGVDRCSDVERAGS